MFENHRNEGKMKLKQMFSRDPNAYVLGEQLNRAVLESVTQKSVKVVSGRYLYDWAKKGLGGIRKCLPFLLKYLNDKGEPKASGHEMEDVIKLWLKDYYSFTSKGNNLSTKDSVDVEKESSDESSAVGEGTSSDKDNDSCCIVEECPENFLFPGMLAVLLFGPLKENISAGRTLDFFCIDKDPIKKKALSRIEARKRKADEEAFDRERISGRGVNHLKQASLNMQSASLAIQKSSHRLASTESAIFTHNLKLTSMTRLKIEAQCAAASNDWSRHDSLAEKVELQEQELGLLVMSSIG